MKFSLSFCANRRRDSQNFFLIRTVDLKVNPPVGKIPKKDYEVVWRLLEGFVVNERKS